MIALTIAGARQLNKTLTYSQSDKSDITLTTPESFDKEQPSIDRIKEIL